MTRDDIKELLHMPIQSLQASADAMRRSCMGDFVHVRGIIEFSNICICNCRYCGLRNANNVPHRYSMPLAEICAAADDAVHAGVDTLVLQSGENPQQPAQEIAHMVIRLKERYPNLAITLSVGERSRADYALWRQAGADRFLIKHETANPKLYASLHPGRSLQERLNAIHHLQDLGYLVGSGFIVGVPGQKEDDLVDDILLVKQLQVGMCGVGPFVPQADTPLGYAPHGSVAMTLRLMSILRLVLPHAHLPATTALATLDPTGQQAGLKAGGNVLMPSFTPPCYSGDYRIYDNKKKVNIAEVCAIIEGAGRTHKLHKG